MDSALSDTQAWFSYAADVPATWPPVLPGMDRGPATLLIPVFTAACEVDSSSTWQACRR